MKKRIGILITCLAFIQHSYGQKALLKEGKKSILKDPLTQRSYVLDTAHRHISAYDDQGKALWTSSTDVCNYCVHCGPVKITSMELKKEDVDVDKHTTKRKKVLAVSHCMCWGYFELETGKYHELGCD